MSVRENDDETVQLTLERLKDRLDLLGITRVGDVTALDTIGVPVWFACRPNSRSLSLTQGKGLTEAQACVSAIMEAAEQYYAERDELYDLAITGSFDELRTAGETIVPLDRLVDCEFERFNRSRRRRWLIGKNLIDDRPYYAPLDIIGMDYRTSSPYERAACRMTSVGLGAGITKEQAILHALLEAIENNATALIENLGLLPTLSRQLCIGPGEDFDLDLLDEKMKRAGVVTRLFEVRHSIDIPVIGAMVEGPISPSTGRSIGIFVGYGCHPSPFKAAVAALLEAVQSRLTDIAGARDDILPQDYARGGKLLQPTTPECPSIGNAFDATVVDDYADTEDTLEFVKVSLVDSGVTDAFVFDLGGSEIDAHVVKVLAANFDNASDGPVIDIGFHSLETLIGLPGRSS